jgi:hypothetical protein
MRVLFAVVLCSLPLHAEGLELEIAPGWTWATDVSASAPMVRARAGYDTGWFTPSLSVFTALLSDPGPLVHGQQGGGLLAWGVAAEARVHSRGNQRVFAALGAGFGQLMALQAANGDTEGYRGRPAPYVEGAVGYQFVRWGLRLGIELTVDIFNRVHLEGDLGTRFCVDEVGGVIAASGQFCPTGRSFPLFGLALTVGTAAGAR